MSCSAEFFATVGSAAAAALGAGMLVHEAVNPTTVRANAWIMTLVSALGLTLVSLYDVATLVNALLFGQPTGIAAAGLYLRNYGFRREPSGVGDWVAAYFATSLAADLVFGCFAYRSYINLLSGWIHHVIYIALSIHGIKTGQSRAFIVFGIEEVPSMVLALGNINAAWRCDWGFGATFFCLRIVYHICVTVFAIVYAYGSTAVWTAGALSAMMHVWWFTGWVSWIRGPRAGTVEKITGETHKCNLAVNPE